MVQIMARCSGTGLEGVTPSLIGENLANRHSCQPSPAVAANQHCHFFITFLTQTYLNIHLYQNPHEFQTDRQTDNTDKL